MDDDKSHKISIPIARENIKEFLSDAHTALQAIRNLKVKIDAFPKISELAEINKLDLSASFIRNDKINLKLYLHQYLQHNQPVMKLEKLNYSINKFINSQNIDTKHCFKIGDLNQIFKCPEALAEAWFNKLLERFISLAGDKSSERLKEFFNTLRSASNAERKGKIIQDTLSAMIKWCQLNTRIPATSLMAVRQFIPMIFQAIPDIGFEVEQADDITLARLLDDDFQSNSVIMFRCELAGLLANTSSSLLKQQIINYTNAYPVAAVEYFVEEKQVNNTAKYKTLQLVRNQISELIKLEKKLNVLRDEVIESVNLFKELTLSFLRVYAIHALYQTINPKKAYTGVNYSSVMHWWHHSKLWLKYDEKNFLFKFIEDLFMVEKSDLDSAVSLIEKLFNRHTPNFEGLHTNSFDTYFLQLLYNEGAPKGVLYLYPKNLISHECVAEFEDYNLTKNKLKHDLGMSEMIKPDNVNITGVAANGLRGRDRKQSEKYRLNDFRSPAIASLKAISTDMNNKIEEARMSSLIR